MAVKHGTAQQAYDEGFRDGKRYSEVRVVELEALLRRMMASNETSNGWKGEVLTELQRK